MARFVSVKPEYTGGGIYIFTGELKDGNYFVADTSFYDVRILNADPNEAIWDDGCYNMDSMEWQDEHLVEFLEPEKAKKFLISMLNWIKRHKPDGVCMGSDLDYFLADVKSLHGNWR